VFDPVAEVRIHLDIASGP